MTDIEVLREIAETAESRYGINKEESLHMVWWAMNRVNRNGMANADDIVNELKLLENDFSVFAEWLDSYKEQTGKDISISLN